MHLIGDDAVLIGLILEADTSEGIELLREEMEPCAVRLEGPIVIIVEIDIV